MKFYIACIQKLSELVQETSGVENRFLACPTLRVYEASDFDFLTVSQMNAEDRLSTENISMQFNSLSSSKTYWDVDATNSLFDLYKERLENLKLRTQDDVSQGNESAQELLHNKDGSPSEALINYTKTLEEYDQILDEHREFLSEIDVEASESEELLNSRKWDVLQKQLALFVANWKLNAHKEEIEKALEQINKLTDFDSFLALKTTIENRLRNAEITGIKSLSEFSKLQIFPTDFNKSDLSWSSLEITNDEVDIIFKRAQKALKGFNEDLLTFDYNEDFIEKITASYCIITVKRPWLNKNIFDSEFVDGNTKNKTFTYANKILLIKDIRVILKENLTPTEKKEIDGNSIIKFGPIFMKNQAFINTTSKKTFIKAITSKEIYTKAYAPKINKKLAKISSGLVLSKPVKKGSLVKQKKIKPILHRQKFATMKQKSPPLKVQLKATKSINNPKISTKQMRLKQTKPLQSVQLSQKLQLTAKTLDLKNIMIYNIPKAPQTIISRVHFIIKDQLGENALYKVEISIKDKRSNYFKEVETDEDGQVAINLTEGNYEITLRKDGFKELTFIESIKKDANRTIRKQLEPQEVFYESYFLVGIIGDQISL